MNSKHAIDFSFDGHRFEIMAITADNCVANGYGHNRGVLEVEFPAELTAMMVAFDTRLPDFFNEVLVMNINEGAIFQDASTYEDHAIFGNGPDVSSKWEYKVRNIEELIKDCQVLAD